MINQFFRVAQHVASNGQILKKKNQDIKDFMDKQRNIRNGVPFDSQTQAARETKKEPHWFWDSKFFLIIKTLLIIYLLLKAVTIFWNELAKLIKAAKNVEAAMM
jgi:hypothetical protein